MRFTKFLLFVCIMSLSGTAFGQKMLEKPFQKWSQDEATKITSSLPFADQYQSTAGLDAIAGADGARGRADTFLGGNQRGSSSRSLAAPVVYIRLHSALPVRQGVVRLRQIAGGYDKLGEDDKKKFDAANSVMLNCPICKDYYVVTMLKAMNSSMGTVDDGLFQLMKLEDFKGKVWLINDKGEKRELEQFTAARAAGDASVFYFKRLDDKGNPFLTPENKDFKFVFHNDLRNFSNAYSALIPTSFEFKVSKIIIDGKVEF
jgi:hypothetical protein